MPYFFRIFTCSTRLSSISLPEQIKTLSLPLALIFFFTSFYFNIWFRYFCLFFSLSLCLSVCVSCSHRNYITITKEEELSRGTCNTMYPINHTLRIKLSLLFITVAIKSAIIITNLITMYLIQVPSQLLSLSLLNKQSHTL